jgi:phosphatidyl-myo-inositol dimannoside synthase
VSPERTSFLVMTPRLDGRDGISEVSRQVVRAVVSDAGPVETWALDGGEAAAVAHGDRPPFRSADGSRRRMVGWTLGRAARPSEPQHVIVMHVHLAPLGATLAARGASLTVFLHGVEAWRRLRPRERFAIRAAGHVVANSSHTVERFRSANPDLHDVDVKVCLLGVADAAPEPTPTAPGGFALIVGRLAASERYKGHDALIDAWPQVQALVPGARLIVAGDGDDRARLETRVALAGLGEAIQFLGQVPDAQLRGLYRACALFAMPSSGEGFGLAYLEAMREGKPCVALQSAAEIIDDGVTGQLLDDASPDVVGPAIAALLADEGLRGRMGRAAAVRVAAHFTEAHFARRFRDALGLAPGRVPLGAMDVPA